MRWREKWGREGQAARAHRIARSGGRGQDARRAGTPRSSTSRSVPPCYIPSERWLVRMIPLLKWLRRSEAGSACMQARSAIFVVAVLQGWPIARTVDLDRASLTNTVPFTVSRDGKMFLLVRTACYCLYKAGDDPRGDRGMTATPPRRPPPDIDPPHLTA